MLRQKLGKPSNKLARPDRNFHRGGRSFYFFDLDDNVLKLLTQNVLFHKHTQEELHLSTEEMVKIGKDVGKEGDYSSYYLDYCDRSGSYRYFRDRPLSLIQKLKGEKQHFVKDVAKSLETHTWQGPSWWRFYYAVTNGRPISIITARGHHPKTIKKGLGLLKVNNHIPYYPNYISIYPVHHRKTRIDLGDNSLEYSLGELKKLAIIRSVYQAIKVYGYSPYHRFGMSDDDPNNLDLIAEAFQELKIEFPRIQFFVISTKGGDYKKSEI